ncbi:hypothetical protein ML462_06815 [Gramella lutea]|uniref:Uncharacterized protein n=1 Tax=Christiangramia lutea TaxID=1607951 RepID=A0A9X2AA62_9FLAO|nr:hypothetical protein [Christiangramia lutea]MCH4822881.1 hypothetical protein [Christiangramia lutea]
MSPQKKNISNHSPFKVPENYFENLEERMMQKFDDSKSLLPSEKNSGFKVPDSYFENLEDKILARSAKKESKVINLFKKEYLYYAAAVAALFIMMIGDVFKTRPEYTPGWDDLEISAMENYIDEGYEMGYIELNTSDYSEFISKNEQLIDEEDFNDINSEAAFDYIDENIDDPSFILD